MANNYNPSATSYNPGQTGFTPGATGYSPPTWPDTSGNSGRSSLFTGCDTLYQEDKSQVRTRSGPRVMAALRNLAIGALRMAGRADVTEATRWAGRSMDRPFTILGLTS